jgi:two-component system, chemotaxis family, chemotaxis protein CheY
MHVLVVDDEIAIVDLVADMLEEEGHSVARAHDGRSALDLLRAGLRPHVVITDVMMPNVDGLVLYETIRNEFGVDVGVLLMSAGRPLELHDSRAAFLPKPFSIGELLSSVDGLAP